jgi:hypothetical protein
MSTMVIWFAFLRIDGGGVWSFFIHDTDLLGSHGDSDIDKLQQHKTSSLMVMTTKSSRKHKRTYRVVLAL